MNTSLTQAIDMKKILIPAACLLLMSVGAPVMAQDGTSSEAMPETQAPAPASITDDQVKAFADAQSRVREISQKWSPKVNEAQSEEEAVQVQESARQEMIIAVQNTGLTLTQYNEIARAAQSDPKLQQRIQGELSS